MEAHSSELMFSPGMLTAVIARAPVFGGRLSVSTLKKLVLFLV
jgi:hypothetical protein